jgi:hypothetical protein
VECLRGAEYAAELLNGLGNGSNLRLMNAVSQGENATFFYQLITHVNTDESLDKIDGFLKNIFSSLQDQSFLLTTETGGVGNNALRALIDMNKLSALKILLCRFKPEKQLAIITQNIGNSPSLLHYVSQKGCTPEMLEALLGGLSKAQRQDALMHGYEQDNAPLFIAARNDHSNILMRMLIGLEKKLLIQLLTMESHSKKNVMHIFVTEQSKKTLKMVMSEFNANEKIVLITHCNPDSKNALTVALDHSEMIPLLLEGLDGTQKLQAITSTQNANERSEIDSAITNNNSVAMTRLLAELPETLVKVAISKERLYAAAKAGNVAVMMSMLERLAPDICMNALTERNAEGTSLLYELAKNSPAGSMNAFIEKYVTSLSGKNAFIAIHNGFSPLYEIIKKHDAADITASMNQLKTFDNQLPTEAFYGAMTQQMQDGESVLTTIAKNAPAEALSAILQPFNAADKHRLIMYENEHTESALKCALKQGRHEIVSIIRPFINAHELFNETLSVASSVEVLDRALAPISEQFSVQDIIEQDKPNRLKLLQTTLGAELLMRTDDSQDIAKMMQDFTSSECLAALRSKRPEPYNDNAVLTEVQQESSQKLQHLLSGLTADDKNMLLADMYNGKTLLHHATPKQQLLETLLGGLDSAQCRAHITQVDDAGITPLMKAVESGYIIETLVAGLNITDKIQAVFQTVNGKSPLTCAIDKGDAESMQIMLGGIPPVQRFEWLCQHMPLLHKTIDKADDKGLAVLIAGGFFEDPHVAAGQHLSPKHTMEFLTHISGNQPLARFAVSCPGDMPAVIMNYAIDATFKLLAKPLVIVPKIKWENKDNNVTLLLKFQNKIERQQFIDQNQNFYRALGQCGAIRSDVGHAWSSGYSIALTLPEVADIKLTVQNVLRSLSNHPYLVPSHIKSGHESFSSLVGSQLHASVKPPTQVILSVI